MEEATNCLFHTLLRSTHSTRMCFTVKAGTYYPCSRPFNTGSVYRRPWKQAVFTACVVLFSNTAHEHG